ncbi:MAG: purine-nucleoside phosphorylase [Bacteroidetes bacterium]|nr:MAG: purine-nucleoside phosphorylase [Bacteroidota bacterium]
MNKFNETIAFLKKQGIENPEIGIVLGTGLGKLVNSIEIIKAIDYKDIPHFPLSTVESHAGKLIYGVIKGKNVLAMQGRFHYYEGYSLQEVTYPIRIMKLLGIKYLLLSNAAGATNFDFKKGSLMLLDDHINFLPDNPLRGKHYDEFGPRFPDMSRPYSKFLNDKIKNIAQRENIVLHEGIYAVMAGPNLETRAEYRYLRDSGADVVGMSTVPEVIVANQMNLPCAAVTVITDECDPDNLKPVSLEEILQVAGKAENQLVKIFVALIEEL